MRERKGMEDGRDEIEERIDRRGRDEVGWESPAEGRRREGEMEKHRDREGDITEQNEEEKKRKEKMKREDEKRRSRRDLAQRRGFKGHITYTLAYNTVYIPLAEYYICRDRSIVHIRCIISSMAASFPVLSYDIPYTILTIVAVGP